MRNINKKKSWVSSYDEIQPNIKGIDQNDFSIKKYIWTFFWIYVMHNCKSINLHGKFFAS